MLRTRARVGQRLGRLVLVAVTLSIAFGGGAVPARLALAQATPETSAESTPLADATVDITGLVEHPGPVSIADLQQYPVETVEASYETDNGPETHTFTGVRLFAVLDGAGLMAGPNDSDISYAHMYVVLKARDGYQVVVSLGEIAPDLGNSPIMLAWEKDGAPLSAAEGPLQMVAPGDKIYDRFIWAIESIEVRDVEEPTS